MWPVVTVRARNQAEVDCLLYAFAQAGLACLAKPGFDVQVGGATTTDILKAVQRCLTQKDLESVRVMLAGGPNEYVLRPEPVKSQR